MITPQCLKCRHFLPSRRGEFAHCKAFPDRIPLAIMRNEHDHRKSYPGDNGIHFEPETEPEPATSPR